MSKYFGSRLRLARLLKGWTQKELGEQIASTRQFVQQLESGVKRPSQEMLPVLCETLNVTDSFFELNVHEIKSDQCHFRKRRTTTATLTNRMLAFATTFESLVSLLGHYIEIKEFRLNEISEQFVRKAASTGNPCDEYTRADIEAVALQVRRVLGLKERAPISNMVRVLEHSGVVVTTCKGVSEKVDALSLNERHPIVIRNPAKESACRMRFDLAHELGHLILHQGIETGDAKTEAEADHFASSFLFPRAAFFEEFRVCIGPTGRFIWSNILKLKLRWKVSQKAIIYRAHSLGLIDSRQYRTANVTLNKDGQAKQEKLDEIIDLERPEFLYGALQFLENHHGITFQKVASTIGVKPMYLAEMIEVELPEYKIENYSNVEVLPPRQFQG